MPDFPTLTSKGWYLPGITSFHREPQDYVVSGSTTLSKNISHFRNMEIETGITLTGLAGYCLIIVDGVFRMESSAIFDFNGLGGGGGSGAFAGGGGGAANSGGVASSTNYGDYQIYVNGSNYAYAYQNPFFELHHANFSASGGNGEATTISSNGWNANGASWASLERRKIWNYWKLLNYPLRNPVSSAGGGGGGGADTGAFSAHTADYNGGKFGTGGQTGSLGNGRGGGGGGGVPGGGGGGAGSNGSSGPTSAPSGGAGGGCVVILCDVFDNAGTIRADGANGGAGVDNDGAGAGGGGGGVVAVYANSVAATGTLTAAAGTGGTGSGTGGNGGNGGSGYAYAQALIDIS